MLDIRIATTAEELEAVARFRYSVYVEEMGLDLRAADHVGRRLAEPEDARSWVAYALDAGEVVATTRLTWGGAGFSDRQIARYGLAPFLAELPADALAVGERHMIAPGRRGADVFLQIQGVLSSLNDEHGVRIVFGACEPHLISYYCRFQRPYGTRNINSPEAGYLIPLLSFHPGPEAVVDLGPEPGMPHCVQAVLDGQSTVTSPLLVDPADYWDSLRAELATLHAPIFEGLDDEALALCVEGSNIIRCAEDDRVLKTGGSARNVFVVLTGALEVNDGEHTIAALLPGDVFGETAYLLHDCRTCNVDVLEEGTRVLSLSERTLHTLTNDRPAVAAALLTNLSKVLCRRLAHAG